MPNRNRSMSTRKETLMEATTGIASPWAVYAGRVAALFAGDKDVKVAYDNETPKVTLFVEGEDKADAIRSLMPQDRWYGNVTLEIEVVPSNEEPSEADLFRMAFAGNPVFRGVVEGFGPAGDIAYALFAPEVVQMREDDISEYGGLTTLTAAGLAASVLAQKGVRISSAPKEAE